jgi:hypothetical protein
MNNVNIEQEIVAAGLTAPRITLEAIEANILNEHFFTAAQGIEGEARSRIVHEYTVCCYKNSLTRVTFCVLVLRNGFTVTGESACVSSENFDAEIGKKIARENAIGKIWPLMGYELRSKLSRVGENTMESNG